ncbi:xanthine dehydrogenase molybdenum binding subunit apoprotein [Dongia mobilis]|uniref:Xanthine dehydrogenase molybdenum binding subunit apoprotein n=1 Tax=Dongia mobilis TaxID=578943 RepID=A0A4R6WQ59_9PROT|nr:molybdopterin cofactor-binding domain-containing protein [Dongia mobilis]TDQ80657.1 xanthine dehydrogenase molybdenum binding subunit apoprotein [Dongia mobilis]
MYDSPKYASRAGIPLTLNGAQITVNAPADWRLSKALRDALHLEGTKIGCDAGDCGACTVLIDGEASCACLVALGQVAGREIVTIEGLGQRKTAARLQQSFLRHGAAQCGICTPGMLVAATALLERKAAPSETEVQDALGGVLCRCTGYRKIVAAVLDATAEKQAAKLPDSGAAVGARIERLDGQRKVKGEDVFGADAHPRDALLLRVIRSPYHHAAFAFGDLAAYQRAHPGIARILTAADIPGENCFGVIPPFADQPVFAATHARFKGEAVAAVVGDKDEIEALDLKTFPITWTELPAHLTLDTALAATDLVHEARAGNILVRGRVVKGDAEAALAGADHVVEGIFETGFVEHAYIEPEAGFARRVGERLEIHACTQAPFMDRDDLAKIMGLKPEAIRIVPTAVGGGFGSKLDLSVQPYLALAAWLTGKPVRLVYSRTESIATTTKRHPGRMRVKVGADRHGKLVAMDFEGDFNTGAYASWGPTVANRVPVHASGPYFLPHYRALTRAVHTHVVPAGAFRGFGVPQATIAQEQLYDMLADKAGIDRLDFRLINALGPDQPTVTGQVLGPGTGIRACFEALKPHWARARAEAGKANAVPSLTRRGVGVAGMWYGCGNTSLPNPSTMRLGLKPDGRLALHQGAVDIGQGSNSVITQICADALGAPIARFDLLSADTDQTPDCGKTSASRQTFVSGKAAELAGRALRARILRLANAGEDAKLDFGDGHITVRDGAAAHRIDLGPLPCDQHGYVVMAEETFDPPTAPLDADGQGVPYAVYGFGAHLVELAVDTELGTVKLRKITAAHDVGRAINPTLVEGQIEGGIAQGIGLALMEEFHPGRGENLHDYLIPTIGDVPAIESILIEDPAPIGPFGAKGIGEQALIPTAPAILNAIADATGVRLTRVPATPDRIRAAILESRK